MGCKFRDSKIIYWRKKTFFSLLDLDVNDQIKVINIILMDIYHFFMVQVCIDNDLF